MEITKKANGLAFRTSTNGNLVAVFTLEVEGKKTKVHCTTREKKVPEIYTGKISIVSDEEGVPQLGSFTTPGGFVQTTAIFESWDALSYAEKVEKVAEVGIKSVNL